VTLSSSVGGPMLCFSSVMMVFVDRFEISAGAASQKRSEYDAKIG
jgi:hypothetical protein